ncbi:MAG: tRNA-dihydrouridine synthase family protein [Bdellovibrionaceae bacterium]|nr:tRNA-dihydrouridine synthase family protein [Pseudobdellovibrionaceae bacterium]MBX3035162.1 tRNA-dihydrouridine synthase family protein [Pseudobdellovibrionaceae bacterium]
MEGVVDWIMRDTLTRLGGIDQCTTEFIRVTQYLHSEIVFRKFCPELRMNSRTPAGTPVFVQLLGGQPEPLARNAERAARMGAAGIDLNFGCPAKTVNRHDGGASLLKCPDRVLQIVKAVRAAVPATTPVTVKIRLGFDDPNACFDNALAAEEGGASSLTVHCRTRTDGYKPPAHWEWMPKIREKVKLPLVANGEIWNRADLERCREVSGCDRFMIGRGAIANPFVFQDLRGWRPAQAPLWTDVKPLIPGFFAACTDHINDHFATSRTKQWLRALSTKNQEAKELFDGVKTYRKPREFQSELERRLLS